MGYDENWKFQRVLAQVRGCLPYRVVEVVSSRGRILHWERVC
jgi:hypothetical protein